MARGFQRFREAKGVINYAREKWCRLEGGMSDYGCRVDAQLRAVKVFVLTSLLERRLKVIDFIRLKYLYKY